MRNYHVDIYTTSQELPELLEGNFFHSRELFCILEKVPGDKPLMAVASQEGAVVGQMLAIIHRRGSLMPPYLYTHAHVHGEGCYAKDEDEIFALLLKALTLRLRHRLCFYVEFSDIQKKMFGYRYFRHLGYIPIAWQEIRNSLHSRTPEERLSEKQHTVIQRMIDKGVGFHEVYDEEEISQFHDLLKDYYRLKIRRFVPSKEFYSELTKNKNAHVYVTTYQGKVIGGSACVISHKGAYLWYAASKRKTFKRFHPDTMTIWFAIKHAYDLGCEHFNFMDAGLPWRGNQYREFILSFGGKPIAKYRWFKFYSGIINKIFRWLYHDK